MKFIMKYILYVVFIFTLFFGFSFSVNAVNPKITFKGMDYGFNFGDGSVYSSSDLFDNFKNVMPGDKLTEEITFSNEAIDSEYVKLFLSIEVKDEESSDVSAADKSMMSMGDFLSQLTMRIYNESDLVYEAKLDKLEGNKENIFLGKYNSGDTGNLRVELDVPDTLNNDYANIVGEVDWVFLLEAFDSPISPEIRDSELTVRKIWLDNGVDRPDSLYINLLRNDEVFETIKLDDSNQWVYTWTDLSPKYTWTVEEFVPEGYAVEYAKYGNVVFITNILEDLVLSGSTTPDETSLSVILKWSGDEEYIKNRPNKVKVTLYDGKEAIESVWLGEWNDWSYTWDSLEGSYNYSIIEDDIPLGYTPSYSMEDNVIVITNIATLIQTGQNYYPALILLVSGILIIVIGIVLKRKKNEE